MPSKASGKIMQSIAPLVSNRIEATNARISDLQVTATASYRLLPVVILKPEKPVPPHLAEKFQKCFSPGVIRIDPKTKTVSVDEEAMRKETMSREAYRHPEFEGCFDLARERDYFLCMCLILLCKSSD
jgi:UPF0288 family protein (methanogenesis marker protein 3)